MRFYVAAILVITDVQNDSGVSDSSRDSLLPKEIPIGSYCECIPAFIPAESMEAAADLARVYAFERWKPEDGWRGHQANILPIAEAQIDAMLGAYDLNALEVDDSHGLTFNFK